VAIKYQTGFTNSRRRRYRFWFSEPSAQKMKAVCSSETSVGPIYLQVHTVVQPRRPAWTGFSDLKREFYNTLCASPTFLVGLLIHYLTMLYQMQRVTYQLCCMRVAGCSTEFPTATSDLPMCDDAPFSVPPGLEPGYVGATSVAGVTLCRAQKDATV
jgi:hypothetical protein